MRNVSLLSSTGRNKTTAREWVVTGSVREQRGRHSLINVEGTSRAEQTLCVFCFVFRVLKDQWIRAKYDRREFTGESNHQPAYCSGDFCSYFPIFYLCVLLASNPFYLLDAFNPDQFVSTLWKKGKDNKQFLKRTFLLSRKDFTLRYYIKEDVSCSFIRVFRSA